MNKQAWRDEANCQGTDTEVFFNEREDHAALTEFPVLILNKVTLLITFGLLKPLMAFVTGKMLIFAVNGVN